MIIRTLHATFIQLLYCYCFVGYVITRLQLSTFIPIIVLCQSSLIIFLIMNEIIVLVAGENVDESETPIQLFSDDVTEYTGDVLSLLLPQIMNPQGIFNFIFE